MLSLPKHLARIVKRTLGGVGEMLRGAQHDVLFYATDVWLYFQSLISAFGESIFFSLIL